MAGGGAAVTQIPPEFAGERRWRRCSVPTENFNLGGLLLLFGTSGVEALRFREEKERSSPWSRSSPGYRSLPQAAAAG
ncbi:hypothetical protein AGIG_G21543 [Arapaima gigas]